MRFAHEAHVMPVIGSSRACAHRDTSCVNAAVWTRAVDLELEEQAVAAGRRELGHEAQPVLVRVDVQEGEVALAQRDEVALGAEVVVERDGRAVAGDRRTPSSSPGVQA